MLRLSRLQGGASLMGAAQTLRALIGGFDLDPNRVLDIVLESLERDSDGSSTVVEAHINLARQLSLEESLPHVLGFKFQHYHENQTTPRSLCRLAVMLLSANVINIEVLLPHLAPSLETLADDAKKFGEQIDKEARRFGVVSLGGSNEKAKAAMQPGTIQPAWSGYGDSDMVSSQFFGVVEALLWDQRWHLAEPLLSRMERAGALPGSYPGCQQALYSLAHFVLEPVYIVFSPRSFGVASRWSGAIRSSDLVRAVNPRCTRRLEQSDIALLPQLLLVLEPLCYHLHVYTAFDASLVTKLARVLKHLLQPCWRGTDESLVARRLLEHVLLPTLSLMPGNPGCVLEVWAATRCLPYCERHLLYKAWRGRGVDRTAIGLKHFEVARAECEAGHDARQALKRVANEKKNAKHVGRALAKTAHSNPFVVFHVILSQIESYDNMIQPIIESFGFMTPLALDVLSYMLPLHLADTSRHKLQDNGIHVSHWFQYLANFTGVFYRVYPQTELRCLIDFILLRLKAGGSHELLVFNELLARMGGCEVLEDISDAQLGGLAGGEVLRREIFAFEKASKRAISRLQDALCTPDKAAPMLALVAQSRSVSFHRLIITDDVILGSAGMRYSREKWIMLNSSGSSLTDASGFWFS